MKLISLLDVPRILNFLRILSDRSYDIEKPVFIVGTGRCGTTLLTKILKSHEQLHLYPGEANDLWHPKLMPIEKSKLDLDPIEAHPEEFTEISLSKWSKFHSHKIDLKLKEEFYPRSGKNPIIKSAMISFMIDKLIELYPDSKFIHIYRYGPSVVESYVKKNHGRYDFWKPSKEDYYRVCSNYWNDTICFLDEKAKELNETKNHIYDLCYESLCENKKKEVACLSDFLEIDKKLFQFDLSSIQSKNYKVGFIEHDPFWNELIELMRPGLELKGYS